jgi:uncharacterized membrane protein
MENSQEPKKTFKEKLVKLFKTHFMLGIVVIVPVWIAYFVASILFKWVSDFTFPIFERFIPEEKYIYIAAKTGSFFISIALVCLLGFFANIILGKNILLFLENLLGKIPMIGTVYFSAKQFVNFIFSSDKTKGFKQVVFIPYPNDRTIALAFLTNRIEIDGKKYVCVFMPTTPNPSTGFLMLYREKDVKYTNYSVDQAFQFIISIGVISLEPDKQPIGPIIKESIKEKFQHQVEKLKEEVKSDDD